ncbi:MAG: hypothetical protein AAFQ80_06570 [Cyanobacteria bacterium J06621_8]
MLDLRHWNSTTCIDFNKFQNLEETISQLFEKEEGCHRIYSLPKLIYNPALVRKELIRQSIPLSSSIGEKSSNLWVVCLFPSQLGRWTVIKTFPTGLLCGRPLNSDKSRLSSLSAELKCNAFYLEVQAGICGFLFESDAMGKTFLSGCSAEEYFDNFYDEPELELQDLITNFSLIDVPESIKKAIKINESPEVIKEEARINEMDQDDPEYFDLIINNPDYTERIDLALADLFDPNGDYWFIDHNLADKVYKELEQLKSMGAKIMYFKSPNSERLFP